MNFLDERKVWRCLLCESESCSKRDPCEWPDVSMISPPFGCHVGALILMDHVERVVV